jgi:CheY-like chemotaxis protein
MQPGPVITVDDDDDDREIVKEVLKELNISNPTIFFTRCNEAFIYLKSNNTQPFIIFCDVNLPEQSGIEFKRQIDADKELRKKSIPFIFLSTSADKKYVNEVYTQMTVQGYFQKANRYSETRDIVRLILEYWKVCKHPNT